MRRLRRGKLNSRGGVPGGNSERRPPCAAMRCASARWRAGYTRSSPVPTTAIVDPAPSSAPSCAAPSMPSASPDTMTSPASDNARANAARCPCPARSRCGCRRSRARCIEQPGVADVVEHRAAHGRARGAPSDSRRRPTRRDVVRRGEPRMRARDDVLVHARLDARGDRIGRDVRSCAREAASTSAAPPNARSRATSAAGGRPRSDSAAQASVSSESICSVRLHA